MDYAVLLKVSSTNLTTVLSALAGSAEVIKIEQAPPDKAAAKVGRGYVGGKRDKGISGSDLVLASLADGPKKREQLEIIFEQRGFARSSVSPTLSRLGDEKKIRYHADTNSYRKVLS